jgi:hypothetical protein
MSIKEVTFTAEEVRAIFDWLEGLSGCSPENVFSWDGEDSLAEPSISAAYKVFKAVGRNVPENLEIEAEKR